MATLQLTTHFADFQPQIMQMDAKAIKRARRSSARPMLAVDPVLLYAKLEVAKMEQDAARKAAKERREQRALREQREAARRKSLEELRASQSQALRRSLPMGAEWTMADGKPCFNTAYLLAALQAGPTNYLTRAPTRPRTRKEKKRDSAQGSSDDDVAAQLEAISADPQRRRFKTDDETMTNTTTKLVRVKNGSQTAYERVEVPNTSSPDEPELLEDQDEYSATRPRLGHDRPHWAQQSQSSTQMQQIKAALRGPKHKAAARHSIVPAMPAVPVAVPDETAMSRQTKRASDTLIADAVKEIKKEQRLRKTMSSLFRRPPCS